MKSKTIKRYGLLSLFIIMFGITIFASLYDSGEQKNEYKIQTDNLNFESGENGEGEGSADSSILLLGGQGGEPIIPQSGQEPITINPNFNFEDGISTYGSVTVTPFLDCGIKEEIKDKEKTKDKIKVKEGKDKTTSLVGYDSGDVSIEIIEQKDMTKTTYYIKPKSKSNYCKLVIEYSGLNTEELIDTKKDFLELDEEFTINWGKDKNKIDTITKKEYSFWDIFKGDFSFADKLTITTKEFQGDFSFDPYIIFTGDHNYENGGVYIDIENVDGTIRLGARQAELYTTGRGNQYHPLEIYVKNIDRELYQFNSSKLYPEATESLMSQGFYYYDEDGIVRTEELLINLTPQAEKDFYYRLFTNENQEVIEVLFNLLDDGEINTLDPLISTNSSNIENGTFERTYYDSDNGWVVINTTEGNNGTYRSEVFDTLGSNFYNYQEFTVGHPYGVDLPCAKANESATVEGGIDMVNNVWLFQLDENTDAPVFLFSNATNCAGTQIAAEWDATNVVDCRVDGVHNKACQFPGKDNGNSFYKMGDLNLDDHDFTFSMWLKPEEEVGYDKFIMWYEGTVWNRDQIRILIYNASTNYNFYLNDAADGGGSCSVTALNNVTFGEWQHMSFIKNDTHCLIYKNGELVNNVTLSGAWNQAVYNAANGGYWLGTYGNSDYVYNGTIDEFSVWERQLSDEEIMNIYARGVGEINLSVRACGTDDCTVNATDNVSWKDVSDTSPSYLNLTGDDYYQYRMDLSGGARFLDSEIQNFYSSDDNFTYLIKEDATYTYTYQEHTTYQLLWDDTNKDMELEPNKEEGFIRSTSFNTGANSTFLVADFEAPYRYYTALPNSTYSYNDSSRTGGIDMSEKQNLLYIPMDDTGTNNTAVEDQSSYGTDGLLMVTGTGGTTSGLLNKGLLSDSVGDYINMSKPAQLNGMSATNFTISFWIKKSTVEAGVLMSNQGGNVNPLGTDPGFTIVTQVTPERWWVEYGNGSTQTSELYLSKNINDNQWHHFLFTAAGTSRKIYFDGDLDASDANGLADGTFTPNYDLGIFADSNGWDVPSYGTMDELAIFNSTFSATEAFGMYARGLNASIKLRACDDICDGEAWSQAYYKVPQTLTGLVGKQFVQYQIDLGLGHLGRSITASTDTPEINNVTINFNYTNTPPTLTTITINSSDGSNNTASNLSASNDGTDIDGQTLTNATSWYLNGTKLMLFNMPFDIVNLPSVIDYSGRSRTAVPKGDSFWNSTDGKGGDGAYQLDGAGDYLRVDYDGTERAKFVGTTPEYCAFGWFKAYSKPTGTNTLMGGGFSVRTHLYIERDLSGVRFDTYDEAGTTHIVRNLTSTFTAGDWYHVGYCMDVPNQNVSIWVNGTMVANGTCPASLSDYHDLRGFGGFANSDTYPTASLNGSVDDIVVYDRILTASQINEMFTKDNNDNILSVETAVGDNWSAYVTVFDGIESNGASVFSGNLAILDIPDVTPPVVTLISPTNDTSSTNTTWNITYNVTDGASIDNCSLFLNDVLEVTNNTITADITQNFYVTGITAGSYTWEVICYDDSGNQGNSTGFALTVTSVASSGGGGGSPGSGDGNLIVCIPGYTLKDGYCFKDDVSVTSKVSSFFRNIGQIIYSLGNKIGIIPDDYSLNIFQEKVQDTVMEGVDTTKETVNEIIKKPYFWYIIAGLLGLLALIHYGFLPWWVIIVIPMIYWVITKWII